LKVLVKEQIKEMARETETPWVLSPWGSVVTVPSLDPQACPSPNSRTVKPYLQGWAGQPFFAQGAEETIMFIGIDVSKNVVDVASSCGTVKLHKVSPEEAAAHLAKHTVTRVVLEATGGYERPVVAALRAKSISVSIINPCKTHHFAQALGVNAKTDPVDAQILARFAATLMPLETPAKDTDQVRLQALVMRRTQLTGLITAENNRLHQSTDPMIIDSIQAVLDVLKKALADVTATIKDKIKHNPLATKLKEVKGVGCICIASLMAFLPELGVLNRKQIAALAGVAPFTRQSGQWKGKAFCSGGRAPVRTPLYMSALVAIRYNTEIKEFYTRLRTSGKPAKVALVACMHKLLIYLNTIAKNHFLSFSS
jgi:transposase